MTMTETIICLFKQGLTRKEIAFAVDVSTNYVNAVLSRYGLSTKRGSSRPYTEEDCVYVNLRNWMNEKNITIYKLNKMIGNCDGYQYHLSKILQGEVCPNKKTIDKLLNVTGFTYEVLVEVSPNGCE